MMFISIRNTFFIDNLIPSVCEALTLTQSPIFVAQKKNCFCLLSLIKQTEILAISLLLTAIHLSHSVILQVKNLKKGR